MDIEFYLDERYDWVVGKGVRVWVRVCRSK